MSEFDDIQYTPPGQGDDADGGGAPPSAPFEDSFEASGALVADPAGDAAAALAPLADTAPADGTEAPLLSVVKKRRGFPIRVNWSALFGVIGLSVLFAFLLGLSVNALPTGVLTWWPAALIAVGTLWALAALAQRSAAAWIGASGVIGLGLAALLATAFGVPFAGTSVGVPLIAIGTGIVLRSILFPAPVQRA
jgi:hypothetical protein